MKTWNYWLAAIVALFVSGNAFAQGLLIDQTSVTIPTFRNEITNTSFRFNDGSTFEGQKRVNYTNSQITSIAYTGTLTFPDGTKVISVKGAGTFDQNLAANGNFGVQKDGQLYFYTFRQGQMHQPFTPNRDYYFENNCIVFYATPSAPAPNYNGTTTPNFNNNDSHNNSNGSGYVSRRADCAGCNGTGKCSHCNGRGYNDRGYKCSLCHGTGTCRTCAGVGKITVF